MTYSLPAPYVVIASREPVEHHGTYPLPEGSWIGSRMTVQVGYPTAPGQ